MFANVPWRGAAQPRSVSSMRQVARELGVDECVIEAVWAVEASGRPYRPDGTVERRFEPHKFPGMGGNWRASLKIRFSRREWLFAQAYAADPEAALDATSWGGPQIMGFNAEAAGFACARDMVIAFARSEDEQLRAFARLVRTWGLGPFLRAGDWHSFALRYNGSGQAATYAGRIERAVRRSGGDASTPVLRPGARGPAVRRLQQLLGVTADGIFGAQTEFAVRVFQRVNGLPIDGIVGAYTWKKLEE